MSDVPDLYHVEKRSETTFEVVYSPNEKPDETLCIVPPRDGQGPPDAKRRAMIIADVLNATRDMVSFDIRDLLEAYEEHHGFRHHADWRSWPSEGGDDDA